VTGVQTCALPIYGVPVASSRASVMPEVLGNAAHYFDPQSVDDIAEKIGEVLDNAALRKQLIAAGAAQVKKYSWGQWAAQTLAAYQSLL